MIATTFAATGVCALLLAVDGGTTSDGAAAAEWIAPAADTAPEASAESSSPAPLPVPKPRYETVVTAPMPADRAPREDPVAAATVVFPDDSPRAFDDLGDLLAEVPG